MQRILLIDDEPNVLNALTRSLRDPDWEFECCAAGAEALKRIQTSPFDLILSDYRMPVMDGIECLRQARALQPDAVRMVLSGHADRDAVLAAINEAGISRFITKPWDDYEVKEAIRQSLHLRTVLVENRYLAAQVRAQREALDAQQQELQRLEREHPGITKVEWAEDGSIVLDDTGL